MRLAVALAGAVAVFLPSAAAAQSGAGGKFSSGEQMLTLCTSKAKADLIACDSFLVGSTESFLYLQDMGEVEKQICVAPGTTPETLREVALAHWTANPDSRRYSAVSNVWNALAKRFACR